MMDGLLVRLCAVRIGMFSVQRNEAIKRSRVCGGLSLSCLSLSKERELQHVLSYVAAPAVHLEPGHPALSTRRYIYIDSGTRT